MLSEKDIDEIMKEIIKRDVENYRNAPDKNKFLQNLGNEFDEILNEIGKGDVPNGF